MGKKIKNARHTEAVHRKDDAAKEMAKLGLKLSEDREIVGFIFDHLAVSHLTYLGLSSINQLCKTCAGVDICIFTQHVIAPCTPPLCPIFNMADLIRWHNHPIITTSIGTTMEALQSNASEIYFYAFDPEFIGKHHVESSGIIPAFCDPRVHVVVRHESHKNLIETEFDIKICETIIPDCSAEALVKLAIMGRKK